MDPIDPARRDRRRAGGLLGDDKPATDQAELRLLHATAGLGNIDLEIAGRTVISGVSYGRSSPVALAPAGSRQLVVRAGTTVLGTVSGNLSADHVNSVVVAGGVPQFTTRVDPDTGAVAPSRANIRFVITAAENSSAPLQLNALLSGTSLPNDSTMRFGIDASTSRYWSLMYFDPGTFTVKFVPVGTNGRVLTQATFGVAAGEAKAVVLRRDAAGTYRVEVVVEP
ncbi:MAG: DUF4397 domain-containing protein [Gemmatimonadales bacterium]